MTTASPAIVTSTTPRVRNYRFPYSREVFDSRIERFVEMRGARGASEIHVELRGLRPLSPGRLELDAEGVPIEVLDAERVPLRMRFRHASWSQLSGIYTELDSVPANHPGRQLFDVLHFRVDSEPAAYWLYTDINVPGSAVLYATGCTLEQRAGAGERVMVRRRWSCPPPPTTSLVRPKALHRRFGGDPIAVRIGDKVYHRRLFIGGVHYQTMQRPEVDGVLNLCDVPNPWLMSIGVHPGDRHEEKGEAGMGMLPGDLLAEARWVVAALHAGQRVLVHCYAGINRSSTVCCAALMLLEGVTAEEALARVRTTHPQARPDPYHWLRLRWLETLLRRDGLAPAGDADLL